MFYFLLIAGLACFGLALRTFRPVCVRKLGLFALMAASFFLVQALTGSVIGGLCGVLLWFALPWIELLTRVRSMDLPLDRPIRRRVPPRDDFPFLDSMSEEITQVESFEIVDDWGCEWQDSEHFYRVFYDHDSKTQVVLCMVKDGGVNHAFIKLVTRTDDGKSFTTWNYPFSSSLKPSPDQRLHWDRASETFEEIKESHMQFLDRNLVSLDWVAEQQPEEFIETLRKEQRTLMDHNIEQGLLTRSGKGTCRYSWRGLVFLWMQLVKDMVRLY